MRIDCSECAMYRSEHCDDCLVTALLRPPAGAVEWDEDLEAPLEALVGGGLIPVLKFRPRDRDERGTSAEAGRAAQ
jgi:hypothetical protein